VIDVPTNISSPIKDRTEIRSHREYILVFSPDDRIYGDDVEDIRDDVMSRFDGQFLTLEVDVEGPESLDDKHRLLPNSVVLVHHSMLTDHPVASSLREKLQDFPKTAFVVVCIDGAEDPAATARRLEAELVTESFLAIVESKLELVPTIRTYAQTRDFVKCGDAARDVIMRWHNAVYDRLFN
jgi:hypothetical protein